MYLMNATHHSGHEKVNNFWECIRREQHIIGATKMLTTNLGMYLTKVAHHIGHEKVNNFFGYAFDEKNISSYRSWEGSQLLRVSIRRQQHIIQATNRLTTFLGMHLTRATIRLGHEKDNNFFGYASDESTTSFRPRKGQLRWKCTRRKQHIC